MIPESNRSSKEFCLPRKAKITIRLGFTDEPELPHVGADALLPPDTSAAAEPAQTADEPEGPNLPPTMDLFLLDTVQFRHNNEAIEFPSAAGS